MGFYFYFQFIIFVLLSSLKRFLKQISASLLALLVIVSTVSVNVDFHICQGDVKASSVFGVAEGCSKYEDTNFAAKYSDNLSISKTPCCKNQDIIYQTGFFSNPVIEFISDIEFSDILFNKELALNEQIELTYISKSLAPPHHRFKDYSVLYQTFLI